MSNRTKIFFRLEQDEDGYPPVSVESVWAIERKVGHEINNIPFYVRSIALGDVVAAQEEDGCLWFRALLTASKHSTIRILIARAEDSRAVRDHLEGMGCCSECSNLPKLIAVDVPPEVDYSKVREYLDQKTQEGIFEYEEGCLGFIEGGGTN